MSAWDEISADRRMAIERFVNGDAGPYKQLWSQAHDVTIFGGWGAYEQGWDAVRERLDWAASRFGTGRLEIDHLAGGDSGDLAYSIDLERNSAFVDGAARPETALRVAHICRREGDDGWRIVHRHADRLRPREHPAS
jgi:ketosteroid isomerase-like protein